MYSKKACPVRCGKILLSVSFVELYFVVLCCYSFDKHDHLLVFPYMEILCNISRGAWNRGVAPWVTVQALG